MRVGFVLLGLVTLTSVHISSGQTCSNGLPGVQNGYVCCDLSCGTCGGPDCATRDGGADYCCVGPITRGGLLCSATLAAPCIIDTCYNGIHGIQTGNVCCDGICGACGGAGCGRRAGGPTYCCTGPILNSGVLCNATLAAPCIVDYPVHEVVCSDGTNGIEANGACCEAGCGSCGGPGCALRPGGPNACCTGRIQNNGMLCANTGMAPCIVTPLP